MSDNVYADLVAAQAAAIERLTRERDEARMGHHAANEYEPTWAELVDAWRTSADALKAERDALRAIVSEAMPVWIEWVRANPPSYPAPTGFDWLTRARAALGGQP